MSTRDLAEAGLCDQRLRAAYTGCADYLKQRNSAAYPAARTLLPPDRRPYWDAILAFATYVDDLIDDPRLSSRQRAESFDDYREKSLRAMGGDDPWPESDEDPLRPLGTGHGAQLARAFGHFVRTWDIPPRSVALFLDTIRTDLHVAEYPTYQELERYVRGVCGEGMRWLNVLLSARSEEADERAIAASFGLQLTDYLRDLTEDLADGRLYLPLADLERYHLTREQLEDAVARRQLSPPLRSLVGHQVERARHYFREAADWWRLVPPATRELPRQYVRMGHQSLEQLAGRDFDIFRYSRRRSALGAISRARTLGFGRFRSAQARLFNSRRGR